MVEILRPKESGGCNCGQCVCNTKSAKKPDTGIMYKSDNGTSYALTYIAAHIGRLLGHIFGDYTLSEVNGKLVVNTGLTRDGRLKYLIRENACAQPCAGECEDGCKNKTSTREIAGL